MFAFRHRLLSLTASVLSFGTFLAPDLAPASIPHPSSGCLPSCVAPCLPGSSVDPVSTAQESVYPLVILVTPDGLVWSCGNDPVDNTDPTGGDYVEVSGGKAFWVVQPGDLLTGIYHKIFSRKIEIGVIDGEDNVKLNKSFGAGTIPLGFFMTTGLQGAANVFQERYGAGDSVMNPRSIAGEPEWLQDALVKSYLANYFPLRDLKPGEVSLSAIHEVVAPSPREIESQKIVGLAMTAMFAGENLVAKSTVRFGQQGVSATFRHGEFAGRTIDEVAAGLRKGAIKTEQLPIQTITRNGVTYTINNRSLMALRRAGFKPTVIKDVTGNAFFEKQLAERLSEMEGQLASDFVPIVRGGR